MKKWYVDRNGVKMEIIEVWETYNGDLYFISEKKGNKIFCFVRLYSMPEFAEWGYNDLEYLKTQYGKYKMWIVPKKNWDNIHSYEKGLLNREVVKV